LSPKLFVFNNQDSERRFFQFVVFVTAMLLLFDDMGTTAAVLSTSGVVYIAMDHNPHDSE
jgi:hypothetical protein